MAEFCKQCADYMGFPKSDFEEMGKELRKGQYWTVLCEGCGPIQTNQKGECVSTDCLCEGHNVPFDSGVEFLTHKEINLSGINVKEIEHGEWSQTMNEILTFEDLNEIPLTKGNFIYVCSEGTYNKYEII